MHWSSWVIYLYILLIVGWIKPVLQIHHLPALNYRQPNGTFMSLILFDWNGITTTVQKSGVMVSTAASQRRHPGFESTSWLGPQSPCFPTRVKRHPVAHRCERSSLSVCTSFVKLATCSGCTCLSLHDSWDRLQQPSKWKKMNGCCTKWIKILLQLW